MRYFPILLLLVLSFSTCKKDELSDKQEVIISKDQLLNAPDDAFTFNKVELDGDCLNLTISYGGGCGEVEVKLIDSGDVAESLPVLRAIRLSFKDEDLCEALVEKTFTFDLTPIRVREDNRARLILSGWDRSSVKIEVI